jgi:hypothetical protein
MNFIKEFAQDHFESTHAATFRQMVATLLEDYGGPNQRSNARFSQEFRSLKVFLWKKGRNQGNWLAKFNIFSRWSQEWRKNKARLQKNFVDDVFRLMGASADWHGDIDLMLAEIPEHTLI